MSRSIYAGAENVRLMARCVRIGVYESLILIRIIHFVAHSMKLSCVYGDD